MPPPLSRFTLTHARTGRHVTPAAARSLSTTCATLVVHCPNESFQERELKESQIVSAEFHDQHVSRLPGRVIQIGVVLFVAGMAGNWLLSPLGMSTSAARATLMGLLSLAPVVGLPLILIGLLGVVMRNVQREQTDRILTGLGQLNRPRAGDEGDIAPSDRGVPASDAVAAWTPARSAGPRSATRNDDSRWRPPRAQDR